MTTPTEKLNKNSLLLPKIEGYSKNKKPLLRVRKPSDKASPDTILYRKYSDFLNSSEKV
jgi:hypothetical protein